MKFLNDLIVDGNVSCNYFATSINDNYHVDIGTDSKVMSITIKDLFDRSVNLAPNYDIFKGHSIYVVKNKDLGTSKSLKIKINNLEEKSIKTRVNNSFSFDFPPNIIFDRDVLKIYYDGTDFILEHIPFNWNKDIDCGVW